MSDHNNSPRGVAEPAIDIGNNYVFPSPSRPGRLVLAMTVFPNAQPGALFSDARELSVPPSPCDDRGRRLALRGRHGRVRHHRHVCGAGRDGRRQQPRAGRHGHAPERCRGSVPRERRTGHRGGRRARVRWAAHGSPLQRLHRVCRDARDAAARLQGKRRQRGRWMGHPGHRRRARCRHYARASVGNAVRGLRRDGHGRPGPGAPGPVRACLCEGPDARRARGRHGQP